MPLFFQNLRYLIGLFFLSLIACQGAQPPLQKLEPGAVILAFGDSLTYGTGASKETSYPQVLEEVTGFKVINAGIPGEESQQGLERIESTLEKTQPKLVLLCLGGNDLIRKKPSAQIKENLKKIIQVIQKKGAQVVLIAVPAFSFSLQVPDFYQDLGKELKIPVEINLIADLERTPQYKSDYIHFNKEGYRALAEGLMRFLKDQGAL
jgi:acyl-CoA thioesterase-1